MQSLNERDSKRKLRIMTEKLGIIFNMQRFSIHDGPGIRTIVFMKGCPMRCLWCDNPESQETSPQLGFIEQRCKADTCTKECLGACSFGAITISAEGKVMTNRVLCQDCGKCSQICYYEARKIVGRFMTVEEVLHEVLKDTSFYRDSGGGVTLSGGEPTMQHEFTCELLKRCKEKALNTAIETCGYTEWEHLQEIIRYVDLVFYDIKHMDPVKHEKFTGVSNKLILENAKKILSFKEKSAVIRIPLIPGYNDSEENIEETARFVSRSGGEMIELLPYHELGVHKYVQYGLRYRIKDVQSPESEQVERLKEIIKSYGLNSARATARI